MSEDFKSTTIRQQRLNWIALCGTFAIVAASWTSASASEIVYSDGAAVTVPPIVAQFNKSAASSVSEIFKGQTELALSAFCESGDSASPAMLAIDTPLTPDEAASCGAKDLTEIRVGKTLYFYAKRTHPSAALLSEFLSFAVSDMMTGPDGYLTFVVAFSPAPEGDRLVAQAAAARLAPWRRETVRTKAAQAEMEVPSVGEEPTAPIQETEVDKDAGSFDGFELDGVTPFMSGDEIAVALLRHGYTKSLRSATRGNQTNYYEKSGNSKARKDQTSVTTQTPMPPVQWFKHNTPREVCFNFLDSRLGKPDSCEKQANNQETCLWTNDMNTIMLSARHYQSASRGIDTSDCRINLDYKQ